MNKRLNHKIYIFTYFLRLYFTLYIIATVKNLLKDLIEKNFSSFMQFRFKLNICYSFQMHLSKVLFIKKDYKAEYLLKKCRPLISKPMYALKYNVDNKIPTSPY